jgi:hypothetical protein
MEIANLDAFLILAGGVLGILAWFLTYMPLLVWAVPMGIWVIAVIIRIASKNKD